MAVIEIGPRRSESTQRQRYSHYFAIAFGVIGLLIGVNLRDSILSATTLFTDPRAGIRAFYPQNWLLDASAEDYIFRVQDMSEPGFKTAIQVAMRPIGAQTTPRNVVEALTLSRSQTLAEYSVFSITPYILEDQPEAFALSYAFATGEDDPFLESLPSVVRGFDVLTIKRGQAIIISFQSDASSYERNLPVFQQFLSELEF
jgi:hypothetical protein